METNEKNEEYYNSLDKRSKEYKEWKATWEQENTIGLGDIVEKVTTATGIKKIVEAFTDDCGCEERKAKLNTTRFKRNIPAKCFTEEEYNWLTEIFNRDTKTLDQYEMVKLVTIEERIFNKRYTGQVCGNCGEGRRIYNDIKEIYETYQ